MSNFSVNFQLWSLSDESCPDETIPVRRITEQDLLRADSINGFGRKFTNSYKHMVCNCRISIFALNFFIFIFVENCWLCSLLYIIWYLSKVILLIVVQHAVALVEGGGFHGAKATIDVWAPQVESPNEFSLAQMWITSGKFEKKDVNTIEAGWQVCEYAQYLLCAVL